jgi:hypothetical protein
MATFLDLSSDSVTRLLKDATLTNFGGCVVYK